MKSPLAFLLLLYRIWVGIVFIVSMIFYFPGIVIPFLFGQRFGSIGYFFLRLWSWTFSLLTLIRYRFYGRENIRRNQSYIFVSNHTSFLDLPGLTMLIPGQYRPLAKKELLKIPVFGWITKSAAVVVDRSSPESRKRSMDRLKSLLLHGISILIFPEGTQNRTTQVLQPFRDGAFRIAIDTQQPVLPLVILGAGPLMPPGTINLKPGLIRIYSGEEISTTELTTQDTRELKDRTFAIMADMIHSQQDGVRKTTTRNHSGT